MKTLAYWARENKNTARWIICIFYVFFNLIALFLGDLFHSMNIGFTSPFFLFALLLSLSGWMLYPSKRNKRDYKNFFFRQKFCDLILVSATFLFMIYFGNALNNNQNLIRNQVQAISVIHSGDQIVLKNTSTEKSTFSKKQFRKEVLAKIKHLRKAYKETGKGNKTLLIALAILGALFLSMGIAALSCNIACSGSEALSIVVLVLGIGGIIFGLIKLIQRISRGKRKEIPG
ncbi:MAG: hypothetical protein ABIN48_13360 [Ginsengibacter sp.]